MPSPAEQYTESLKKSQQAVIEAIEAWTKSTQGAFNAPAANLSGQNNSDQVIDQVFDFAEQMLAVQRQFAKNLTAIAANSTQSKP
jgi:uncharacterized protein (DUF1778 family)